MTKLSPILAALLIAVGAAPAGARTAHPARCTVPRLSGVTLKVARRRITHAHCRVGTVHRPKIASANELVSRQSPKAGRKIRRGSKVTLWLKAKPVTLKTTAPVTNTTVSTPATVRASLDPGYTQDPSDPLKVTWSYDASATGAAGTSLPAGVLTLSVQPDSGGLGPVGGCSIDVGGAVTGGTCTVELPSAGAYTVTVTYEGSGSIAPATATETDTITDPNGTGPPATWEPTTTSVAAGQVTVSTYQKPPPTDQIVTTTTVPVEVTTTDPYPTFDVTVTDLTTGATAAGTVEDPQTSSCSLQFGGPSDTTVLSGCGITSMPFAYTDALNVTVTVPAAWPYEASTSAPVEVWSGSLPPNVIVQ